MMDYQRCPMCLGTGIYSRVSHPISAPRTDEQSRCPVCNGLGTLSDADLLTAYQRTSGEPGDPAADALCAEIERRGLDV